MNFPAAIRRVEQHGPVRRVGRAQQEEVLRARTVPDESLCLRRHVELAKRLVRARDARTRILPAHLSCDPGLDILLDIFLAATRPQSLTVKMACLATNVPKTTALRYIHALCDEGLIARAPHARDQRSVVIELSKRGLGVMAEFLEHAGR